MPRKPIAIATAMTTDAEGELTETKTIAICDDGSVWDYLDFANEWERLADIPSEQEEEIERDARQNRIRKCRNEARFGSDKEK